MGPPLDAHSAVRARWGNQSYKEETGRFQGPETVPDGEETGERGEIREPQQEVVVDLTQDETSSTDISEDSDTESLEHGYFKMIRSDLYDRDTKGSPHFVTISDILGDDKIVKSILFSYQFQLDFILEQFHRNVQKIVMVAQEGTITPLSRLQYAFQLDKCQMTTFPMPHYTAHHSKMIINFYQDETCRIFIPSNNFTYNETNLPQQVCWSSERLPRYRHRHKSGETSFETNLIRYLKSYHIDTIDKLIIKDLQTVNFQSLSSVEFVFSTPRKNVVSGLPLLNSILKSHCALQYTDNDENVGKPLHFLCQTSSMGTSLSQTNVVNLFTNVMIPSWLELGAEMHEVEKSKKYPTKAQIKDLFKRKNVKPYILFPTLQEIKLYPAARGWFHFHYHRRQDHYQALRDELKCFYKQDPTKVATSRGLTPCHSKFYIASMDPNFSDFQWCCYTSANLSVSAWGTSHRAPRNYEVGVVMFNGECESFHNVAAREVRYDTVLVPFTLPPVPYETAEGTPGGGPSARDEAFDGDVHESSLD